MHAVSVQNRKNYENYSLMYSTQPKNRMLCKIHKY
jgi:hypothetical protein